LNIFLKKLSTFVNSFFLIFLFQTSFRTLSSNIVKLWS